MRKGLFWLNDKQWAQIEPHLPKTGPARDDDRRIIGGVIHMLQCGARWRDCPPDYGPYTTIYNRSNRWAKRGHRPAIFEALARCGKDGVTLSIDLHFDQGASLGKRRKGGSMNRQSATRAVGGPRKSTH
jgi:transposase